MESVASATTPNLRTLILSGDFFLGRGRRCWCRLNPTQVEIPRAWFRRLVSALIQKNMTTCFQKGGSGLVTFTIPCG